MNKNNMIFESGQYYTLSQLFSEDNKIVIPDLQRDYCWGNNVNNEQGDKELVSGFVRNLTEAFKGNPSDNYKLTLGLIYGYEQPKRHIQLCDGQQRITTLFLLLGMLNRKTNNEFRQRLIYDFELNNDDKEPYLQYAIRESTLYFLSDLVCEFFLKSDIQPDEIKNQDWYFAEYDLDASIQSMLAAIVTIENLIKDIDGLSFGNFILNNLQMLYYDMGDRAHGEETFVVINTTGEPLTATENLKPMLLGNIKDEDERKKYSQQWEDREEWFWKHRGDNQTADNGHNEFLRWVALLLETDKTKFQQLQKEDTRFENSVFIDKLDKINLYFEATKKVFDITKPYHLDNKLLATASRNERNKTFNGITQRELLMVLPTIEFVKCSDSAMERDIVRVKHFFDNQQYIDKNTENKIFAAVESVRAMKTKNQNDIAEIRKYTEPELSPVLSDEEKIKFEIYCTVANREEVENLFWETEKHSIWKGEILPLIEWASTSGSFCFDEYKKYNDKFITLFHDKCDPDLDVTRRALLTRNLKDYPRKFRGKTNYSFCWEYNDWKTLIYDNRDKFKDFLDKLIANTVSDERKNLICGFADTEYKYYNIIKREELLEYCENKNVQLQDNSIWLIKKINATTYAYEESMMLYLKIKGLYHGSWDIWFWDGGERGAIGCGVADENTNRNGIAIDYFFNGKDYTMQVFHRDKTKIKDAAALWSKKLDVSLPSLNKNERYEITGDYETIKNYVMRLIS
jgi:uncharacterized protein with ParB-like and HNH nuclease domain